MFRVFLLLFFGAVSLYSQVKINEVYPAPVSDEPEWLELFVTSESSLVQSLFIYDASGAKAEFQLNAKSKSYCVITKDTSQLKLFRNTGDALLIQAKLPALNNTTDFVVLRTSDEVLLDSFYYDIKWGKKGYSFERISCHLPADPANIAMSVSLDSASCGYVNSVSKADLDICVSVLEEKQSFLIENCGNLDAKDFSASVVIDCGNNISKNYEEIDINLLEIGQEKIINLNFQDIKQFLSIKGDIKIILTLDIEDDRAANNSAEFEYFIPFDYSEIMFNEVLFDADSNAGEFLEFYNNSQQSVNLKDWKLLNYSENKIDTLTICKSELYFEPKSFLIVFSDTNLFNTFPELLTENQALKLSQSLTINNSEDKFILLQKDLSAVDSFSFSSKQIPSSIFPKKNRSLEKINKTYSSEFAANWSASLDDKLATPLQENSLDKEQIPKTKLSFSSNPLSKSRISQETITIYSQFNSGYLSCKVFDTSGRLTASPINLKLIGRESTLDAGCLNSLQIGAYIIYFEITDSETNENITLKELFVISK